MVRASLLLCAALLLPLSATVNAEADAGLSSAFAPQGDKPAEPPKREPAKLPATDPKAETLLREAWERMVSLPAQKDKPLERLAANAVCKAEPSGGGWWSRAAAKAKLEAKTAYVKGKDFTLRVLDSKEAGAESDTDEAMIGVVAALTGTISKISFALHYIIGVRPFGEEFKDATFEIGEAANKEEKCVKVWRDVLGRAMSSTYFIGEKGKGAVLRFLRDGRQVAFTVEKSKKQFRVTKLEFTPESVLKAAEEAKKDEGKKEEPKKEEKKDEKKDAGGRGGRGPGGGGPGGGGRWPGGGGDEEPDNGVETYTLLESKNIKGYDIFTKIGTSGRLRGAKIPLFFTLSDIVTNADATDELIADGGCGPTGEIPGADYNKNPNKTGEAKKEDKPAGEAPKGDTPKDDPKKESAPAGK